MNEIKNLQELADLLIDKNDYHFEGWDDVDDYLMWASALATESSEVVDCALEYYGFGSSKSHLLTIEELMERTGEELADVFIYLVLYSKVLGVDLNSAVQDKIDKVYKRFGVE